MRLYHRWRCPWCAAARQAIENVGAEVELVEVPYPREDRDEVAALSGQRRVPALVGGGDVADGARLPGLVPLAVRGEDGGRDVVRRDRVHGPDVARVGLPERGPPEALAQAPAAVAALEPRASAGVAVSG